MAVNTAQLLTAPSSSQSRYSDEVKRRLQMAQLLQQAASDTSQPVYKPSLGYAKLAAGLLGGVMEGMQERSSRDADTNAIRALFGRDTPSSGSASDAAPSSGGLSSMLANLLGGSPAADVGSDPEGLVRPLPEPVQPAPMPPQPQMQQPVSPQPMGQAPEYFAALRAQESGGNDAARAPTSTATGRYQFTEGTWNDLSRNNPQLGLTPDGRVNPQQQEQAIQAFTAQNAQRLQQAGIEPTPPNLYMAHFLGSQGGPAFINAMQQNPDAPAASVVGQRVAQANQSVFFRPDGSPRSVGEVYQLQTQRFTQPQQAAPQPAPQQMAQAPQQPAPQQMPGQPLQVSRDRAMAILSDPNVSPQIKQMVWQQMQPQKPISVKEGERLIVPDGRGGFREVASSPAKSPDDVRKYEYAKNQGYSGNFEKWQLEQKRAGAPINMGSIPPGYRLKNNADGGQDLVPIPGGPADLKQKEDAEKKQLQKDITGKYSNVIVQDIGRALNMIDSSSIPITGLAAMGAWSPLSPAHQLDRTVAGINSYIAFERLGEMRQASPTGGALGAVSAPELDLLKSAAGSLAITQNKETVVENLKRIQNMVMDTIHGTPAQISALVSQGKIPPDVGAELSKRNKLSFDERGNPTTQNENTADGKPGNMGSAQQRNQPQRTLRYNPATGRMEPIQ